MYYILFHHVLQVSHGLLLHRSFVISCVVVMLAASMWVWHVRNTHLRVIKQHNKLFGTNYEEYNLLRNMRKLVVEVNNPISGFKRTLTWHFLSSLKRMVPLLDSDFPPKTFTGHKRKKKSSLFGLKGSG